MDMPEPEPEAMECNDAFEAAMSAMIIDGHPCHKPYPCASAAQPTSCCPDEPDTPPQSAASPKGGASFRPRTLSWNASSGWVVKSSARENSTSSNF